jgi:hypothetical protein
MLAVLGLIGRGFDRPPPIQSSVTGPLVQEPSLIMRNHRFKCNRWAKEPCGSASRARQCRSIPTAAAMRGRADPTPPKGLAPGAFAAAAEGARKARIASRHRSLAHVWSSAWWREGSARRPARLDPMPGCSCRHTSARSRSAAGGIHPPPHDAGASRGPTRSRRASGPRRPRWQLGSDPARRSRPSRLSASVHRG